MGERVILNKREGRLSFPHHGFSVSYSGPTRNFYAWELYSPSGKLVTLGDYEANVKRGDAGRATVTYSKEMLLQGLLGEAEHHGVEVFPGSNVTQVRKVKDAVRVVTSEGKVFDGRFVIAADGRNSRVARYMGFNKEREFYGTVTSSGYDMAGLDLPHSETLAHVLVQTGKTPKMAFIIPRAWNEDEHMVFSTIVDPYADREAFFEYFTKESVFAPWFRRAKKVRQIGVCGNVLAPARIPFRDNVLLVGDAGWCQEAEMTGAVMSGWKAAHSVTYALVEGKVNQEGVKDYIEWWKTHHLGLLDHHVFLRNVVMPVLCTDEEIDYIFSKIDWPLPTCLDPYETPRYLGAAMQEVIPVMQKERPELVQKMVQFSQIPSEVILHNAIRAGFPTKFSI
jgi:flavin-dependent dehydrogenase